jgi:hypothetical protein
MRAALERILDSLRSRSLIPKALDRYRHARSEARSSRARLDVSARAKKIEHTALDRIINSSEGFDCDPLFSKRFAKRLQMHWTPILFTLHAAVARD